MLKMVLVKADGTRQLWIGLAQDNLAHLSEGLPIHFKCEEIGGPPDEIVIISGKDVHSMANELREHGLDIPEDI
jgi:hypothetical protein